MSSRLLFLLLSLSSTLANAQDRSTRALTPELIPIWQEHAVLVDGSQDPQAIPYGVAMDSAFRTLATEQEQGEQVFREAIQARFSTTDPDLVVIADMVRESRAAKATVVDDSTRQYDQLCVQIFGRDLGVDLTTLDAVEVATKFSAVEVSEADRLTAHYRERASGLSAPAQATLETYLDSTVRPRLRWGHDLIGLAAEVPQAFLSLRRQSCENRLAVSPSDKNWRLERYQQTVPPDTAR